MQLYSSERIRESHARHPSNGWDPVLDFVFVDQRHNWMTSSSAVVKRLTSFSVVKHFGLR
jgi:hypothetical protein